MALSSATRRFLSEAALWLGAGAAAIMLVMHFDEVRAALGITSTVSALMERSAAQGAARKERTESGETRPDGPGRTVRLQADSRGHFQTKAHLNGRPVEVLVDTGATAVALTWEDAQAASIHVRESDFTIPVNTANGVAYVAATTLDTVAIGDIEVRDVRAVVARPGQMRVTLLGMSFLRKLARVDMRGRTLILAQ